MRTCTHVSVFASMACHKQVKGANVDGGSYNYITYCAIENHSNTVFFTADDLVLHCRFDTLEQNVALPNTHAKHFICVCHKHAIGTYWLSN